MLFFVLLAYLIALTIAQEYPGGGFRCEDGILPGDPEYCQWMLQSLMHEPWTHERIYFSNVIEGRGHTPIYIQKFGCELAILPMNDASGAAISIYRELRLFQLMIQFCLIEHRRVAVAGVKGIGDGVLLVLSGPSTATMVSNGTVGSSKLLDAPGNQTIGTAR